jgi:hypothetical protein
MTRLLAFLFVLSSLLCAPTVHADEKDQILAQVLLQLTYPDFPTLESFAKIEVVFEGEDAKKIGLDSDELTDLLRLKFKNNFAGIPYKDAGEEFVEKNDDEGYMSSTGMLFVQVWITGTDYPVAYHIEISAGSLKNPEQYETAVLGYGSKDNVPDVVKKAINDMVEQLAITFFKARGEL